MSEGFYQCGCGELFPSPEERLVHYATCGANPEYFKHLASEVERLTEENIIIRDCNHGAAMEVEWFEKRESKWRELVELMDDCFMCSCDRDILPDGCSDCQRISKLRSELMEQGGEG